VAVSFAGLSRYDGWRLERLSEAGWERVDQSVVGGDYWQSTYDGALGAYTLTFNLRGTPAETRYRLRWSAEGN
jgi:hypothetical protein